MNSFISKCNQDPTKLIDGFFEEYRWLSNFHVCENGVMFEDVLYPSSENAYQAAKTLDLDRRKFFEKYTPSQAKTYGGLLVLRSDWECIKLRIMGEVLWDKFERNPDLREKLLATGDAELVEGNWWKDRFWGVYQGEGLNWLGRLLMQLREVLRNAEA